MNISLVSQSKVKVIKYHIQALVYCLYSVIYLNYLFVILCKCICAGLPNMKRFVSTVLISFYLQFRGDGGVSWHGLGGQFIITVRAVEEGFSALVVSWKIGVEDQTRAGGGLGVQRAAAGRRAILHIEAENR